MMDVKSIEEVPNGSRQEKVLITLAKEESKIGE
jgi:hypothetical protein